MYREGERKDCAVAGRSRRKCDRYRSELRREKNKRQKLLKHLLKKGRNGSQMYQNDKVARAALAKL